MISLITPHFTSLEAKNLSTNRNILDKSFLAFHFQMVDSFMNSSVLDFTVKILVFSP